MASLSLLSAPVRCAVGSRPTRRAPHAGRSVSVRAVEIDSDTVTLVLAAVAGIGLGVGVPVLFAASEKRDKERIESIRELNRANLRATGQLLSDVRGACAA